MAINAGPKIVEDGLVFCVDAANKRSYPSTNNEWNDLTPNGYNGQLINGASYSQEGNGSMLFDGANDYVDLGSSFSISTSSPFSVEFWSKLSGYYNFPTILQLKTNTSNGWNISFSQHSSYKGILFGSSNTWSRIKTNNPPSLDVWNHVCLTYDTSNYFIYLNLSLQNQYGAGGFNSTTQNNYIGSTNAAARGATDTWNGYISNVKLYNKLLTFEEIKQNYNATKWRFQ